MRRETQNVLLVLLGGALLKIALTGTYLRYVKPSLFPWLVLAGAAMVALAAIAIVRDVRGRRDAATGCGLGHEHGSRSPWMLLLPVLAIFLVAPPALGSDSIGRAGQQAAAPQRPSGASSLFPPLPPGPVPLLTASEFTTRAVWDGTGALEHRPVRLQGFVVHPPEHPERTRLARMRISCCAADAAPVLVELAGPAAGGLAATPADTWIEVTGTLRPGSASAATGQVPTAEITAVRGIPAPPNPYEY